MPHAIAFAVTPFYLALDFRVSTEKPIAKGRRRTRCKPFFCIHALPNQDVKAKLEADKQKDEELKPGEINGARKRHA